MAKIIDRITLDLNKDELYVWEMKKSRLVVDAMREGIKIGCDFPAVDVVMSESGIYQLLLVGCLSPVSGNYGGHNRAFTHYIEGALLKCSLWNKHPMEDIFDVIDFKPVSEIKLVEDCYVDKLRDSLSHLPLCSTIDFCRNNDLDFKNYLSQQSL